jgi:hypothetical protein
LTSLIFIISFQMLVINMSRNIMDERASMIARRYDQQRRAAGRAAGTATVEILTSASGNGTRTVFSRPRRTESSSNQGNPPPPFPFENLAGSYTGGVDWNWAGGAPEVMKFL